MVVTGIEAGSVAPQGHDSLKFEGCKPFVGQSEDEVLEETQEKEVIDPCGSEKLPGSHMLSSDCEHDDDSNGGCEVE